ncbi:uncharacterized protein ACR2FA_002142 [Aphomia sociella]
MFYPVESLKRGGRFYLCWVADSWPLRFATITQRQLWSQDIRNICEDLLQVLTNESGRPVNRFSLRLSSQLLRGLVRLYQRKVSVVLGDLCMINANVIKNINKKWNAHILDLNEAPQLQMLSPPPQITEVPDEPENEQRIAELIQNSGNVVLNIQDITLKESAIPEIQLPPNDDFGEENPDQSVQLMGDRTVEVMLQAEYSGEQHSALAARGSRELEDRSGRAQHLQMERVSEHDLTMFRKSTGDEILPAELYEKDIPEIPEVPFPEFPAPQPQPDNEMINLQENLPPVIEVEKDTAANDARKENQVDIELEELEDGGPPTKRRRMRKLIIDKKIKISGDILHARTNNPRLELRCEDSSDDIVDLRIPANLYFRRPCHSGVKVNSSIALALTRLYQRNLGVISNPTHTEREMEEAVAQRSLRSHMRSQLQRIEEEVPIDVEKQQQILDPAPEEVAEHISNAQIQQVDISDMPTQKLETLSQARKRKSDYEISPKRQRSFGYTSFRQNQDPPTGPLIIATDADKENVPQISDLTDIREINLNYQELYNVEKTQRTELGELDNVEKNLMTMLGEAGLADINTSRIAEPTQEMTKSLEKPSRKNGSETSETPLGSLDRTKVSLGDSENTTDSRRFIHDQWGTTGTMVKILNYKKASQRPLTVRYLISKGPIIAGYKCIIAARCFTSILKLKQHGFIYVSKDPETLEVTDIFLGPKFDKIL